MIAVKSPGQGFSCTQASSTQSDKGKEAMEIDDNDLGQLKYNLELGIDDVADDLPHSTLMRDNHDLAL